MSDDRHPSQAPLATLTHAQLMALFDTLADALDADVDAAKQEAEARGAVSPTLQARLAATDARLSAILEALRLEQLEFETNIASLRPTA